MTPTNNIPVSYALKNSQWFGGIHLNQFIISIYLTISFYQFIRLRSHIEKVHSEKMYQCTTCLKAFATIGKLKVHQDKHSSGKKIVPNLENLLECESVVEIPQVVEVHTTYNALNLSH